jgi:nucleoside-diphosphate-sugar epimerase
VRVFVTGAGGFIGGALSERLRADGAEVRGMDLRPVPELGVVAGDVTEGGAWIRHAEGSDVVVHTAAYVGGRVRRADEVWRVNTLGTRHALDAAQRAGARFLHLSSVTVFGLDFPPWVDEEWPVRPSGLPYMDTKIAAEQVVLAAHAAGEAEVTVIRPGDVYGPRADMWGVRPVEAIRARRFTIPEGVFSPVYVDNLVDALVAAAGSSQVSGRVISVTDGVGVANREFFTPFARLAGRRLTVLPLPLALAAAQVGHWLRLDEDANPLSIRYLARRGTYSNARARELLDWEPRVGLEEGQARACEWLRASGHA